MEEVTRTLTSACSNHGITLERLSHRRNDDTRGRGRHEHFDVVSLRFKPRSRSTQQLIDTQGDHHDCYQCGILGSPRERSSTPDQLANLSPSSAIGFAAA